MSIAEVSAAPPVERAGTIMLPERAIQLRGVSWKDYLALREPESNNHLRMTYDCGDLEIMSPSGKHAKVASLIDFMICEWTMLQAIEMNFGADMTFTRQDVSRGLEADKCYWIANEARVRGKDEIDLSIDPPPDLALEVEVSHPLIPKFPIYQALGVPEVWHWHKDSLGVLSLDAQRQYREQADSNALPGFPFRLAEDLIRQREAVSGTALMLRIRKAMAKLSQE